MSNTTPGPREYRGWTIWPRNTRGMWTATNYTGGHGQLAADTLQGMKEIIRHTMEGATK